MRLSSVHQRALHLSFGLLWLSGLLWLIFHYFLRQQGDFGPAPHVLEKWWLRLHGLAVFAMLLMLGSLITAHGRLAWRVKRQRRSGLSMLLLAGWLVGSGYALYYLVDDRQASWLPLLHWAAGLAAPLWLWSHRRRQGRGVAARGSFMRSGARPLR